MEILEYNISVDAFLFMNNEVKKRINISYKRLWKLLIDKDMKKKDLATVAGISQSSVAKMSRGEPISMDVLLKICSVLQCDIGDLVEAVPSKDEEKQP